MRLSLHEFELPTLNYDPGDCLRSGSPPAVSAMTVRANTNCRRCAETYLAAITATGNLVLLHYGYYKPATSEPMNSTGAVLVSDAASALVNIFLYTMLAWDSV